MILNRIEGAKADALAEIAASEDASPLPVSLDDLLKPWVRERIDKDGELAYSADSLHVLAEDIARIGAQADDYGRLRGALAADIEARQAEAVWRIVDDISWIKTFAVAVDPAQGSAYALRLTALPGIAEPNGTRWWFAVLPLASSPEISDSRAEFPIRVRDIGPAHREGFAHLTAELLARPDHVRELSRGWAAFGKAIVIAD